MTSTSMKTLLLMMMMMAMTVVMIADGINNRTSSNDYTNSTSSSAINGHNTTINNLNNNTNNDTTTKSYCLNYTDCPDLFNQSRVEQVTVNQCPGMTSNNWAVDYALQTGFTQPLPIDITLQPYSLGYIDDLDQTMGIRGEFSIGWDIGCPGDLCDFLKDGWCNLTLHGTSISIIRKRSQIWVAPVYLDNYVNDSHPFLTYTTLIDVSPCVSYALWVTAGMFHASCNSMSFQRFPFDFLSCNLSVTFELPIEIMDIGGLAFSFPIRNATTNNSQEFLSDIQIWRWVPPLVNISDTYTPGGLDSNTYRRIGFQFQFQRDESYFIQSIFIPTLALILLQFCALILPPHLPDRSTFSMAIVLAFTISLLTTFGDIPVTSERIYVVELVLGNFIIGCLETVYLMAMIEVTRKIGNRGTYCFGEKFKIVRLIDSVFAICLLFAIVIVNFYYIYMMMQTDDDDNNGN